MAAKSDWIWIETLFKKIRLPYQMTSIFLGFFVYFCFLFFSKMVNILPLNFHQQLSAISMSIIIPFMLGGIQYLVNIMKWIIMHIDAIADSNEGAIYISSKNRFISSNWRYVIMSLVILPFYIVDWITPFQGNPLEHFKEIYLPIYSIAKFHTVWGLSFDIYLQALGLFSLILLSYVLWTMFNITWILKIWENSCSYNVLDESIFNINMRITAIKSRILKALLFYFVCISLAIISYLNPSVFFSGETGILLILLLIGISFFFLGLGSIQRALKCQVEFQLDDINKLNQ